MSLKNMIGALNFISGQRKTQQDMRWRAPLNKITRPGRSGPHAMPREAETPSNRKDWWGRFIEGNEKRIIRLFEKVIPLGLPFDIRQKLRSCLE